MKNGGIIAQNSRVKAKFNEQMRKIVCGDLTIVGWSRVGAIKGSAVKCCRTLWGETVIGHCSNSPGHKASYTAGHYLLFLPALSSLCMQCVLQSLWAGLQSAVDTSFCCYRQLCYAACRAAQCSLLDNFVTISQTVLLSVLAWKCLALTNERSV